MRVSPPGRRSAAARTWSIVAVIGALVGGLIGGQSAWAETDALAEPAVTGSISGVVTADEGASTAGVRVVAYRQAVEMGGIWWWHGSAVVGADGAYLVADLPDGDYRIEFATDFASASLLSEWWDDAADEWLAQPVTVSGGQAVEGISASLAGAASISGVVTDEAGAPVPGVSVRARTAETMDDGASVTDAAGRYQIQGLRAGSYLVEFTPGTTSGPVAGEWWDDASVAAEATPVSVPAGADAPGIDAVLASAGSIDGIVSDATGAPVPNVMVGLYQPTTDGVSGWMTSISTDDAGAYTLGGLAAGEYKVQFSTSGPLLGEWYEDAAAAASADAVRVGAAQSTRVDAQLERGASISGIVRDEAGAPVGNSTVIIEPVSGAGYPTMASTSPDGSYSIVGLTAGEYRVQFTTEWASTSVVGEWWDDAKTEGSARLISLDQGQEAADISAVLSPGGRIAGVVRDGSDNPILGATVSLRDADGAWLRDAWTGTDGAYSFQGLDAGTYGLLFTYVDEHGTLSEWWDNAPDAASADTLEVAAGETVDGVDVVLSADDGSVPETHSASLSGVVRDASGRPLDGVTVSIDGGASVGASTDANGVWRIPALPAGEYVVTFSTEVDGELVTQWWGGGADYHSANPIRLLNGEQRIGIDAVFPDSALPVLDSSLPVITGQPRVGKTLKAHARDWTYGTRFTYQWFADGAPIAQATGASLVLTPQFAGVRLTVSVTGTLAAYRSGTETSEATAVVTAR